MQDRCLYCAASETSFVHLEYNCRWARIFMATTDSLLINFLLYRYKCESPQIIVDIIEKCWAHDHALRPSALEVSKVFEEYLELECTEAQVNNYRYA